VTETIHPETLSTMYLTLTRRAPLRWGGAFRYTPYTPSVPSAGLPLDIRQTDEAYVIEASVPGYSPEQVQVTVDKNWLVIHADRNQESETTEGGYVRRERRSASLHRRLALPEEVDVERISASFSNGELAITVPRSARPEPRRVPVVATNGAPAQGEAAATHIEGDETASA
jgi:HSP20 family protein